MSTWESGSYNVEIECGGIFWDIGGYYYRGCPAQGVNPPETDEFEISTISLAGETGIDFVDFLNGMFYRCSKYTILGEKSAQIDIMDKLEELVLEKINKEF